MSNQEPGQPQIRRRSRQVRELTGDEAVYRGERARAGGGGVRKRDVTVFLRQLILLLEAGTPILKSLQTLARRGERASVRALVGDIAAYVENGNPLWQAFERHPRFFDTVFVNLIKASEASGTLVPVLKRVTSYRERREMLEKRVRSAMIYPLILVAACFGVLLLLTKYTIPQFQEMFRQQQMEVPPFTQTFLGVANGFASYGWWIILLAVAVLVIVYKVWWVRSPLRRLASDRLKLRLPVVGPIMHKNALVEFSRTMALLLKSGLSMMATLDLTRSAIHNQAVSNTLQRMRDSVEQGGGLEEPMRASYPVIPAVFADMFVTGEETGRVDEVAEQIANQYDEDVSIAVNNLGELLMPVLTVFIGGIVLLLFVALFLPILALITEATNA
jgi:type IV pilus assembly protein PilC